MLFSEVCFIIVGKGSNSNRPLIFVAGIWFHPFDLLNSHQGTQNCQTPWIIRKKTWRTRPSASNVSSAKIHNGMAWGGNGSEHGNASGAFNQITVPQSLSRVYATGSWDLSASPSLVPGLQRRAGCDGNTNWITKQTGSKPQWHPLS